MYVIHIKNFFCTFILIQITLSKYKTILNEKQFAITKYVLILYIEIYLFKTINTYAFFFQFRHRNLLSGNILEKVNGIIFLLNIIEVDTKQNANKYNLITRYLNKCVWRNLLQKRKNHSIYLFFSFVHSSMLLTYSFSLIEQGDFSLFYITLERKKECVPFHIT